MGSIAMRMRPIAGANRPQSGAALLTESGSIHAGFWCCRIKSRVSSEYSPANCASTESSSFGPYWSTMIACADDEGDIGGAEYNTIESCQAPYAPFPTLDPRPSVLAR